MHSKLLKFDCLRKVLSLGALVTVQLVGATVAMAQQSQLLGVRFGNHSGQTRLVLDMDSQVQIKNFSLDNPPRFVVDIPNTANVSVFPDTFGEESVVSSVRHGIRDDGSLRLVFETDYVADAQTRYLKPMNGQGHRVVLDLRSRVAQVQQVAPAAPVAPAAQQFVTEPAPVVQAVQDVVPAPVEIPLGNVSPKSTPAAAVVAEVQKPAVAEPVPAAPAPVAVAPAKPAPAKAPVIVYKKPQVAKPKYRYEKDITLDIAKRLARLLEQAPDITPVLIRTEDEFVHLGERVRRTRKANADLLISLHADAFDDARASGSSVYVLSTKNASSTAAKFLAEKENKVGGVDGGQPNDLRKILFDLSQGASRELAYDAASRILRHVGKVNKLHKKTVEHAGFVVLRAPDVPSVLVEMAFISNPKEEQQLLTSSYQERFAGSLRDGVIEYFMHHAPYGTEYYVKYRGGQVVAAAD